MDFFFLLGNGIVSFIASLAAFIVWHHYDLERHWRERRNRNKPIKAREL